MLVAPLAFPPHSLSFPAPWHFFFIHLQSVKMMLASSGDVARAELRQKYLSSALKPIDRVSKYSVTQHLSPTPFYLSDSALNQMAVPMVSCETAHNSGID